MSFRRQSPDQLLFETKTDQQGVTRAPVQDAIVKSLSIAEPVPGRIENHPRNEKKIERSQGDDAGGSVI